MLVSCVLQEFPELLPPAPTPVSIAHFCAKMHAIDLSHANLENARVSDKDTSETDRY